jgi:hypothetical protein
MTVPENDGNAPLPDQWEFVEPSGHADAGLPAAQSARPAAPGKAGWAEAAVVAPLAAAAACQLAWLLCARALAVDFTTPVYLLPQQLAGKLVAVTVMIAAGVLVIGRRGRAVGLCATVAVGMLLGADTTDYNPRLYARPWPCSSRGCFSPPKSARWSPRR